MALPPVNRSHSLLERRWYTPIAIAVAYAVVSFAWILLSDRILPALIGDLSVASLTRLQTFKGLLFIALTAGFIYLLIRMAVRALQVSSSNLAELETGFQQLFTSTGAVILIADSETGQIVDANPSAERFYGRPRGELIGELLSALEVTPPAGIASAAFTMTDEHSAFVGYRHHTASGERDVAINSTVVSAGSRQLKFLLIHDVTERRALENQLRQAQKMEAVGQLTGGIAHDLNNILTVVLADADLIGQELPDFQGDIRDDLDDLRAAARRGASMIRKLLSFSRSANIAPVIGDLGNLVGGIIPTLRRLLPENIDITASDRGAGLIRVDQGSLEQIILNLATNARDAMKQGGTLTIETGREALAPTPGRPWLTAGVYAYLKAQDTGTGMDERTRAKAFEPFFTTKPPTEGSGLGLAMIYGLVKQHEGYVVLDSAPGEGTAVTLYLPLAPEGLAAESVSIRPGDLGSGGGETILLVEDEEALRRAGHRILEKLGYTVLGAPNGQRALEILEAEGDRIDLVISDMIMPRLGGRALYEIARVRRGDIKFLFTSGYAAVGGGEGTPLPDVPFIQKPWTYDELSRKVREVLSHSS
ncbi:MAG: ATP-binding protein [Gemmatimonadota bacterium]